MNNFYIFLLASLFYTLKSNAQSQIYSVPVVAVDQNLRDSVNVLGRLDLDFPVDGTVFIQFDGEGYASPGDRIILGANIYPDWDTNDGNVSFKSIDSGEGHNFSHTRTFPVTAGQHSFYAVGHNYVNLDGSGIATIYGTLSVEFIPVTSDVKQVSSITVNEFEAITPVAYDTITIEASGPGKIEVRLNGAVDCSWDDTFVVGISETTNWNYTHPGGLVLEANHEVSPYVVFSKTEVFEVPGPGTYTYYAMVERAYEENGVGLFYAYTNFHARYYPDETDNILEHTNVDYENLNLTGDLRLLDSIQIDVTTPGKVEVRFDGGLQMPFGKSILLAAGNKPSYELQDGSVVLQSNIQDINTLVFVHSQVYDVTPGSHTFYIMAKNFSDEGSLQVDLQGRFVVKYYAESIVSANDYITNLDFEVWPNPVFDRVNIQYENTNDKVGVTIMDMQGNLIHNYDNMVSGNEMDLSGIPSGMYLIQMNNGKEQGTKKLVKL